MYVRISQVVIVSESDILIRNLLTNYTWGKDFMLKKLIVLGNGFDLACGLPTSYKKFFAWLDAQYNQKMISSLHTLTGNRLFNVVFNNNNYRDINFWYLYMSLIKLDNPDWYYVENTILTILNLIEDAYDVEITEPHEIVQYIDYVLEHDKNGNNDLSIGLPLAVCFFNYGTIASLFNDMLSSLEEFENLFNDYLNDMDLTKITSSEQLFRTKAINITTAHYSKEELSVLNFNYTNTFEMPNVTRFVHGTTIMDPETHLIFGIDSTNIKPDDPKYIFTKRSRIMFESIHIPTPPEILSPQISNITFLGHSLNDADYSYFQSIFDYLSIYDNSVTLTFCYTDFHKKNSNKMKEYQLAINTLLCKYGSTLGNDSHGDNLVSKLLLENRLQLQYISNSL